MHYHIRMIVLYYIGKGFDGSLLVLMNLFQPDFHFYHKLNNDGSLNTEDFLRF
ncbi:hypothetical protein D9M72_587140 [compost metagenome]